MFNHRPYSTIRAKFKSNSGNFSADFSEEAEDCYARIIASGESIAWDDMKNYLKAKASNKEISLPKSRKLVR